MSPHISPHMSPLMNWRPLTAARSRVVVLAGLCAVAASVFGLSAAAAAAERDVPLPRREGAAPELPSRIEADPLLPSRIEVDPPLPSRTEGHAAPDLPALVRALGAIEAASAVRLARTGIDVEEANRQRLQIGPYEYGVRGFLGQRRDPSQRYYDGELVVERPIRLPAKMRLDHEIGAGGVEIARLALTEARHESGRLLLAGWFALAGARAELALWDDQTALIEQQLGVVQGRLRAGDAPRVDLLLAEAAVAQARQGQAQARARVQTAAAELEQTFPSMADALPAPLATPRRIDDEESAWQARVLEHNRELLGARAQARQAERIVERVRAERRPDPSLGVRYASERSGNEHVIGVLLSVPLPGAARDAAVTAAIAQARLQADQVDAIERRVAGEARIAYRAAQGAWASWARAEEAAERLTRHAELAARGYTLGEGTLNDVLLARRAANDARLAAVATQAKAREAYCRLALDAYRLWPLEDAEIDAVRKR